MKDIILRVVYSHNGIKAVTLALDVIERILPAQFETIDYHNAICELVQSGELIELEYIEDDSDRIQSIYFVRGTIFVNNLKGGVNEINSTSSVVRTSKGDT